MNIFKKSLWDVIKDYEKETDQRINVIDDVEIVLGNLWTSVALSESIFENKPPQLSSELLIMTYYLRNISFLIGSYQLAKQGLVIPSHTLQRTVIETLVKGYLFIVDEDVSDMNLISILSDGENDPTSIEIMKNIVSKGNLSNLFLESAQKIIDGVPINLKERTQLRTQVDPYTFFNKNIRIIYSRSRENQWRNFYGKINTTAHPSVRGVRSDVLYNRRGVEESLELILLLAYGNILMYLERFYNNIKDPMLSEIQKESLDIIVKKLGQSIAIEPTKAKFKGLIQFRDDNYKQIL